MARSSRRVLTVLFADLVGFTALSERLDAEDVAAIQQAYFGRAREAIVRRGGVVEKYIGDAVVGSFGVLRARDDDAEQAVRAALEIVAAVERVGVSLGLEHDALQVRVGVNTGEVLISHDDVEAGDWRLTGDVVNVAARLQAMAHPSSVLIGAQTALAVEPVTVLEAAGDLALQGRSSATAAWTVVAAREFPVARRMSLGEGATTLGRERELALLYESWRASDSAGDGWLIMAPPGVGKSRLVSELSSRVAAAHGDVWSTTASPADSGYQCVAALLRQSLGPAAEPDALVDTVLARLARRRETGLRDQVSAEQTRKLLAGEPLNAEPADLYASWICVLDAHVGAASPVWVIEDLHHAGPDLLAFLRSAAATPPTAGRLLIATSRPSQAVEEMRLASGLRPLQLANLSAATARQMAERLVGQGVLPEAVVDRIAEVSGGNPLFVEELLRSWVQGGALEPTDEHGWRFTGTRPGEELPTTVQSVYLAQLDGLPEYPRRVIHAGSIPGQTFPAKALPVLDVPAAEPALGMLTGVGLLAGPHPYEADRISYTYRHGLLREVAYATLPRLERARLHARFARWLQATSAEVDGHETIGMHLSLAYENTPRLVRELEGGLTREQLAAEAGTRLEQAAEQHMSSAPQRAVVLLERARELVPDQPLPDQPDPVAVRRTLRLGEALHRSGRAEEAMATFVEVADLAAAAGRPTDLVTAALRYEEALFASRLPRSRWGADGIRLLSEALVGAGDTDVRARLLAALGRARFYRGEEVHGRATLAEAVTLAQRNGSDATLASALLAACAARQGPDELPGRSAAVDVAVRAARRAGDREIELEAARLQFVDHLRAGDIAGADAAQARAEALIAELRRPLYFWYPPMWAAMRSLLHGDMKASEEAVDVFLAEASHWHYNNVLPVHAVQALELYTLRGEPAKALPLLERLAEEEPLRFTPILPAGYARAGRLDEARAHLQRHSQHHFEKVPRDLSWTHTMALIAETADAVGDRSAAAEAARQLRPWVGHAVVVGSGAVCLGAMSHFAGLASRAAGDIKGAVSCLEAAVRFNEALGAAPALLRSRAELQRTRHQP